MLLTRFGGIVRGEASRGWSASSSYLLGGPIFINIGAGTSGYDVFVLTIPPMQTLMRV
jgi:hypothetical protein